MKKKKEILKRIVSGTIASSILLSSCTKEYNVDENSIYGNLSENSLEGSQFLSIKYSNLSEEFFITAQTIGNIIKDITNNSSSAKLFCDSPEDYFKKNDINLKIKLSDKDILILKSLTDDEIKKAINEKDLKKFIRLCKEKGYINLESSANIRASRNIFKDDKSYENYLTTINDIKYSSPQTRQLQEPWFIPAAVVAIAYAAVLLYVAAYVDVAYYAGAVYKVVVTTRGGMSSNDLSSINKTPVVKLWLDNNEGKLDFDILHTELINNQAEEISQIMLEEGLCADKSISKKIILTNLEAYYGLRK